MSRSIKAVDCSLSICAGYSLAPIACCRFEYQSLG